MTAIPEDVAPLPITSLYDDTADAIARLQRLVMRLNNSLGQLGDMVGSVDDRGDEDTDAT